MSINMPKIKWIGNVKKFIFLIVASLLHAGQKVAGGNYPALSSKKSSDRHRFMNLTDYHAPPFNGEIYPQGIKTKCRTHIYPCWVIHAGRIRIACPTKFYCCALQDAIPNMLA
jgi:hypothetical protein